MKLWLKLSGEFLAADGVGAESPFEFNEGAGVYSIVWINEDGVGWGKR